MVTRSGQKTLMTLKTLLTMTSPDARALNLESAGTVSEIRSEMCDAITSLMRVIFDANAMDVTLTEVPATAALCLEMTEVDINTTGDPVSFAEVALSLELKLSFVVDMFAGWDLEDEGHVEEVDRVVKEDPSFSGALFVKRSRHSCPFQKDDERTRC